MLCCAPFSVPEPMRSIPFPQTVGLLVLLLLASLPLRAQNIIEGRADSATLRAFGNESTRLFQTAEQRRVRLSMLSTVSAIEAVAKGEAEIALSARGPHALKPDETGLDFHAIAWEALALVVHPGNQTPNLSLRQLRDIYLGKITRWDQVGGPPAAINLYAVAGPLDGIEYGLRRALFGAGHRPVAATRWYLNTEQLEAAVTIDPYGLGVAGLSNVRGNAKLKTLRIEGALPQLKTVRSGEYLLVTPLYLVHRGDLIPTTVAMRYARFLGMPTINSWLESRELLPVGEARLLNQTFTDREQRLLALLKTEPAVATPAAPAAVTTPLPEDAPAAAPVPGA
jgi:phosphate transport system substrate-binding protein